MNPRSNLAVVVAVALMLAAVPALARNPHCSGGIQYVTLGMRDKEKGNTEDYQREMNKAVEQLEQCTAEDPADLEAMGYLGWAYAELDSAGPAGVWFAKAIAGLAEKGDKKKLDIVSTNRESYWARAYNDGIKNIGDAQQAFPDYTKAASEDEAPLKEEAGKRYEAALASLTRAKLLKPGHAATIRNLATCYAFMGRFDEAEVVLRNGLTEAAADPDVAGMNDALKTVRSNKAGSLLDAGKYDEAIAYYRELTALESSNADHFNGLGNALFNRAQKQKDQAKRDDFKAAGEAYGKGFELKPESTDLGFNAALSFQYAGELAMAEGQWRAVLKQSPDDPEALSSLGSTLADMQKFGEAVEVLQRAVNLKPDNKIYFRQLGAVYNKAGNNPKSTEMLMMFMAMNSGKSADDAAAAAKGAKAGTPAASTFTSYGAPDKVYEWSSDGRALQTWVYLGRKQAFTFDAATLALFLKSDWSPAAAGKK